MNWPHAPTHWLFEPGLYMVTAGTHQKLPHWNSPGRLDFFLESMFARAVEFGWELRAWAVLANHYHFVAVSPPDPGNLRKFLGKLHMQTAKQINLWDSTPGRKVWFQFWDSRITFEKSYLAWLHYVHYNPALHGVVPLAENYKWCSASWFARNTSPAFVATVKSFKTGRLTVPDDF
jgi:putative transposase